MMDDRLPQFIIALFACTGFWELVKYLASIHHRRNTANEDGTLAVLHELIYPKLEKAILAGRVGIEEFDRIDNLAQPYFRLGGNGTVKRRYDMVNELPRYDDRKDGYIQ